MKIAFVVSGFSSSRLALQPWVYVDRIARGLSRDGHVVTVVTDEAETFEHAAELPYSVVGSRNLRGIGPFVSGHAENSFDKADGRWNLIVRCVGWTDFAFGGPIRGEKRHTIGLLTVPTISWRDALNLIPPSDSGAATKSLLLASFLFSRHSCSRRHPTFDGVVVTSSIAKSKLLARVDSRRLLLAGPGVDREFTEPCLRVGVKSDPLHEQGAFPVLTYCGPPRKERGFTLFLVTAKALLNEYPDLGVQILARPDSPRDVLAIENVLKRGKLQSFRHAFLTKERLPRSEYAHALRQSDLVMFPWLYPVSISPVSLLEALAVGARVVTTPLPELAEIATAHGGVVSTGFSCHELRNAVKLALDSVPSDPTHPDSNRILAVPTWDDSVALWNEFINTISERSS